MSRAGPGVARTFTGYATGDHSSADDVLSWGPRGILLRRGAQHRPGQGSTSTDSRAALAVLHGDAQLWAVDRAVVRGGTTSTSGAVTVGHRSPGTGARRGAARLSRSSTRAHRRGLAG